ncbi:MAG: hypothetical protein K6F87_05005 [Lachnospiraceae bacterium]|nr:hypothetical protein [Lachnospiraceae bacterium]
MKKLLFVIFAVAVFVDTVVSGLFSWFLVSFGVSFREIIYTVKSPLKGANNDFFLGALRFVGPMFVLFVVLIVVCGMLYFGLRKYLSLDIVFGGKGGKEKRIDGIRVMSFIVFAGAILYSI